MWWIKIQGRANDYQWCKTTHRAVHMRKSEKHVEQNGSWFKMKVHKVKKSMMLWHNMLRLLETHLLIKHV